MKKQLIIVFLFFIVINNLISQSYSVINVDPSKFPVVKANFIVNNSLYNSDSLSIADMQIEELGAEAEILNLKVPKTSVKPSSIVLVLDISSSMLGARFDILKQTAKQFVEMLPLDVTEVAIATFNNEVSLNCDFTHNIETINTTLNELEPVGGTDYNNAFLTRPSGAIFTAASGKYRRVIIFITDGLSDVHEFTVSNAANADSIMISNITIGLPISDKLKFISKETGGRYFSNINRKSQIEDALKKIYIDVQYNAIGSVEWLAKYSCNSNKNTSIKIQDQQFQIEYLIPNSKLGYIDALATNVFFKQVNKNVPLIAPVFLKGNNIELNVTNISTDNDKFTVAKSIFPISSSVNEVKRINLIYTPTDSLYAAAEYLIENPGCPDIIIDAASSGKKKLKLTSPTEGMHFFSGNPLPIKWKGIDKTTVVDFYFQAKKSLTWEKLGEASGLSVQFTAPVINDSIRILGKLTNQITLASLLNKKVKIMHHETFKKAFISTDTKSILTLSNFGTLISWDINTGLKSFTYENKHSDFVGFYPNYNRLISVTDTSTTVYTNRNGMLIMDLGKANKKLFTSFTHLNGNEIYASIANTRSIEVFNNDIFPDGYFEVSGSADHGYIVGLSNKDIFVKNSFNTRYKFKIQVSEKFKKAVLHGQNPLLIVEDNKFVDLFNLRERRKLASFSDFKFIQFLEGSELAVFKRNNEFHIIDCNKGRDVFTFKSDNYEYNSNVKVLAYCDNNILHAINLDLLKRINTRSFAALHKISFFPETNRILVLTNDSLKIWNFDTDSVEFSTYANSNLLKEMFVMPGEQQVLLTTDHLVALWSFEEKFDADTTGLISIIVPKPSVASGLSFGKQYINEKKETTFNDVVQNNTSNSIHIDSIYFENNGAFNLVIPYKDIYLNPDHNLAIEITFMPKRIGERFQKLIVASGNEKYECVVSGEGIVKAYELPTALVDFGTISLNSTIDTLIPLVYNSGTESYNQIETHISASNFTFSNSLTTDLKSNDTLWLKIEFSAKKRGRQNAIVKVNINDQWISACMLYAEVKAKRELYLVGKTINTLTNQAMASEVLITELRSGNIIQKVESDKNGNFIAEIKTDLNYSISGYKEKYFSSSQNIDLRQPQISDTIFSDIYLTPIVKNSTVKLNNIFFEFGKAILLDISKTDLNRLAVLLVNNSYLHIEIQGHTDNVGDVESNYALSKQRANAVKEYLQTYGINESRISIKYFGESQPIASNDTDDGRKANRRVEIKFTN